MTGRISRDSEVKQEYFNWLCEVAHIDTGAATYWILAKDLHSIEFTWLVPNDDNRAADGISLREEFSVEHLYFDYRDLDDSPCSMLEMLIGLARRMEFELCDVDDTRDYTASYFWEMLDNIGLLAYDDDVYIEREGTFNVEAIINIFLNRDYRRNGDGGLFPLIHPREDQRSIEIWYQMQAYIHENYPM